MTLQRLTFLCQVEQFTGYGQLATHLVRGLANMGIHVQIRSMGASELFGAKIPVDIKERFVYSPQPEPFEILISPPHVLPTPGKRTCYFTMWETTRVRPVTVEFLNRAEDVIVPNSWNASCFSAAGVDRPIHVVPLGIDPNVFAYRRMMDQRCIFGCAGRMAHGGVRKGINEVIEVFQKAFPTERDVMLRVKAFADCPVTKINDDRIMIEQAYWSDQQVADWLASLTCFVTLAKGEGWGLLAHQALGVGRPVISVFYSGVTEFLTPNNSYHIDFTHEPAQHMYYGCGTWAQPSEDHAIELMRHVYRNRQEAESKGVVGSRDAHRLSWANTCSKFITVLHEVGALQPHAIPPPRI